MPLRCYHLSSKVKCVQIRISDICNPAEWLEQPASLTTCIPQFRDAITNDKICYVDKVSKEIHVVFIKFLDTQGIKVYE